MTAAEANVRPLARAGHRRPASRTWLAQRVLAIVPVVAVLVMQAVMSYRLIYATSASNDEALYLYSGHQLIHEMWHGGGSPYYETYFSGAPVIYPVFAAALDHVGGLALVRLVSGVFMLIATGLLFATARHLFGYWPAELVTDIDSSISFSPDGTKFVYLLANNPTVGEYRVIIRTLEGGAERTLATAPLRELVANAAWSPDGKTIVTPVSQPGDQLSALAALDVESGKRNLFVSRTTCISHGRSGCRMAAGCWLWVRTPSPTSRRLFLFLFLRARCRRSRATPTRIPISVWPPMAAPSPPSSSRPIRIPT